MNDTQKSKIDELKKSGNSANYIARELNISLNTIKSYLRRKDKSIKNLNDSIDKNAGKINTDKIDLTKIGLTNINSVKTKSGKCLYCGKPINNGKTRQKKFCNDTCRMSWWKEHSKLINRKTKEVECQYCHKIFNAPSCRIVKYCSHDCYVADRFNINKSMNKSISKSLAGGTYAR